MSEPSSARRGRRVLMLVAVAGALVVSTMSMAGAAPGGQSGGPNTPRAELVRKGATLHYAVPKANCGPAKHGLRTCFSRRLIKATKGTPGAVGYSVPAFAKGPAGGFTPGDFASAYGFDPKAAAGATQTVAIIDAFDDAQALTELNTFDRQYGLPTETASSFRKVNQDGNASPLPSTNPGWATEIALDIEAVRGVCNACHILLVEAKTPSGANLATAVNTAARLKATEISNSYGGPESVGGLTTSSPSMVAAYNHPGIVITASAGDDGWYGWDRANALGGASDNAPSVPASYPTVVAVGGTALSLNADGTRNREVVWNENGLDDRKGFPARVAEGASGSGCSRLYDALPFQASVPDYAMLGCASGKRAGNDIAADADPFTGFDVFGTTSGSRRGWITVGGTSLSSPLISAMWALAGGAGGVARPAQNLYEHLVLGSPSLYDVTSGGTAFCAGDTPANCEAAVWNDSHSTTDNPNVLVPGSLLDCGFDTSLTADPIAANLQCNAASGYDGPSGIGTPVGLGAFRPVRPTVTATWPTFIKPNSIATFRVKSFSDPVPGATASSYVWKWGDGTKTTTASTSATHRFPAKGRFTVSLQAVDNGGRTSRPVTKTFTIGFAPAIKVSGPTSIRKGGSGTYRSTVTEINTGGKITSRAWRIGSTVVGHSTTLTRRFRTLGTFSITLSVTDNSGLSARSNILKVRVHR